MRFKSNNVVLSKPNIQTNRQIEDDKMNTSILQLSVFLSCLCWMKKENCEYKRKEKKKL